MKTPVFPALALVGVALPAAQAAHAQTTLPGVEVRDTRDAPGSSLGLDTPSATGSRLGPTPRETPASVSSLSSADIAERNLFRAQDVAIRMPGITESLAPGNGGTSLVARGIAGHNSVVQTVDGTRLVGGAGTISYPFSTWPFESVEVLRGPASVLYGDGAIGAAVNYITKQPLFDRTEREAFFGTLRGGVGLLGPISDTVAYAMYLDAGKSDGYRPGEDVERQNYSLALAVRPSSALKLSFSLDGGHNDDARYFGTPLLNGSFDSRLRRTNYNVADAVVQYDDRMWRAKAEYQLNESVRLRNETYYLTADRHWRNTEAYTLNAAGTRVDRSDYLEILHDQAQTGNRFDASFDGAIGGMKSRFLVGLDWYRTKFLQSSNSPYGGASSVNPFVFAPGNFISPVPTLPARDATLVAHARRKFMELHVANKSTIAATAIDFIGQLYGIEREVKAMEPAQRLHERRTRAAPVAKALHEWLIAHRARITPGTATARAIDYSLKRWVALTRYLEDPALPIDNNFDEQQIRPWAMACS